MAQANAVKLFNFSGSVKCDKTGLTNIAVYFN